MKPTKLGMDGAFDQVKAFDIAVGNVIGDVREPKIDDIRLRVRLIAEEFQELLDAIGGWEGKGIVHAVEAWLFELSLRGDRPDIPDVADALADIAFVVIGSAVRWGIPLGPIFDEVTRANIAKAGGEIRADGKRLKPPGWTPPDIEGVLKRAKEDG